MRRLVIACVLAGAVAAAQAGDGDAVNGDSAGRGACRSSDLSLILDLGSRVRPGDDGLEHRAWTSALGKRSALPRTGCGHGLTDAGLELRLDLADAHDVRLGMLSSFQDETVATEPIEEQAAAGGQTDLAAAAQNPIANTISVPFENNFYFFEADNDVAYVLNFQPVIPVVLNDEWNLINRPIIPLIYVPGAVSVPSISGQAEGFGDTFGLGDINYTGFVSPAKSQGFIWGIGPSLTLPTATDDLLGSGKWSAGPSFVGLTIQKPILAGILLRHLWSFAGPSDRRSVNQSLIQPFFTYNLDGGWYLMTAPVITANWAAESSDRWTVPLGGGFGKLMRFGDQPVNMNLQVYYNVERPENASDWALKFTVQLLFPK